MIPFYCKRYQMNYETNMREERYIVTIGENGRMIIPAAFRKQLNLKAGEEVTVKLNADNDIIVHSPRQSLKKLQDLVAKKNKKNLVEALIKMRRNEEI